MKDDQQDVLDQAAGHSGALRTIVEIQKQLLPDLMEKLQRRYQILRHIMLSGVVGRRTLAGSLSMTERVLRAEVDLLKTQGLLETDSAGMHISEAGKALLADLEPFRQHWFGLPELERQLCAMFHLRQAIVVPGDSDVSADVKKELGRVGAKALRQYVSKDDVIAVTGGSTMAEIALRLTPSPHFRGNWFVPARGGLGESVELQANTIASLMAKKTGGQYRLLHVPDHLSEEAYQSLIQEPNVQDILEVIRGARIVVHGIGNASVMARRRGADDYVVRALREAGATAEAFGYYFDRQGKVVQKIPTAGLRLEDLEHAEVVIAVAGGVSKSEAIAAILRHGREHVLVTDEAAAKGILR